MKYVNTESTDIYYNLALEEHIFEHYKDDSYLFLWKNDVSVVLGKYQNVYEELNLKEAEKRKIKVARRNTGGGTVFHDTGNLNYSFITDFDPETFSDYDEFIAPVIEALNQLGVPVAKRNNSDIAIGDLKISGSAQTIKKGRILHHGTLLFDADLSNLHTLLRPTDGMIESKAVKSVRSKVVNVKEYILNSSITVADLEQHLLEHIFDGQTPQMLELTEEELQEIQRISSEKYSSWQWNYGMSPSFTFQKQGIAGSKAVKVSLTVVKGRIIECDLSYGSTTEDRMQETLIRKKLVNQRYSYGLLKDIVETVVGGSRAEAVTDCLF